VLAAAGVPVVIDPVMIAKGGAVLLQQRAIAAMRERLIPQAALLTPNSPEAAALTGLTVETTDDLRRAGEALLAMGRGRRADEGRPCQRRSGYRPADHPIRRDQLLGRADRDPPHPRHRLHPGLGDRRGSGPGLTLEAAVARAWAYVAEAIRRAPGFGAGAGPLDHGWPLRGP